MLLISGGFSSMHSSASTIERSEFQNEVPVDFSKPENRKRRTRRWHWLPGNWGKEYPLIIGGEKFTTTEKIRSTNPAKPDQVIGVFQKATVELGQPGHRSRGESV
jgi:1-pyrroline-5-carboxylate dehydrogenase